MRHFEKVVALDPEFYKNQVNLRMAEISYLLDQTDEAIFTLAKIEGQIRAEDKYLLHLLKGKCYDKLRQFKQASIQFGLSKQLAVDRGIDNESLGHILFRLGWSIVRSNIEVHTGIEHLRRANELLLDFPELKVKLAGVLFQESGTDEDIRESKRLLEQAIALDANCAEALILQGKISYRRQEWQSAAESFEKAIKVQPEKNADGSPANTNTIYYAGSCYEKAKNLKKAMHFYKQCLSIDSNH